LYRLKMAWKKKLRLSRYGSTASIREQTHVSVVKTLPEFEENMIVKPFCSRTGYHKGRASG